MCQDLSWFPSEIRSLGYSASLFTQIPSHPRKTDCGSALVLGLKRNFVASRSSPPINADLTLVAKLSESS
jgi:hypothetical protein